MQADDEVAGIKEFADMVEAGVEKLIRQNAQTLDSRMAAMETASGFLAAVLADNIGTMAAAVDESESDMLCKIHSYVYGDIRSLAIEYRRRTLEAYRVFEESFKGN